MIIKRIITGMIEENSYIIMDENSKEAFIVDPGADGPKIEKTLLEIGAKLKMILLTHGHFDHVGAVEYLANRYNVPFYINKSDEEWVEKNIELFGPLRKADLYLNDNEVIKFADSEIKTIHTPGHTEGGMCFLIEDNLFTGDTLFQGAIGRTDFPGGSFPDLIKSVKEKLLPLGDDIKVYSGHGEASTIALEKERNPYIQ